MILKKIGQVKNVPNKLAFCAIPQKNLILVDRMQAKGSELSFYKNFEVCQKIQFDSIGELRKELSQKSLVFAIDNKKVCFINPETYEIREVALKGQITAKIEDYYLVNNIELTQLDSNQSILFEKNIGMNPYYHHKLPTNGYVYGHSKTSTNPAHFGDTDKTFIACFSIQTGKELWHYAGQEPLSFIGNTTQHLWVFSGNGQVLLFDIQTGQMVASIGQAHWRRTESASTAAMHSVIGGCSLDKTKLIALGDTFYQEISAKTFKFKNRDLSEEFGKYEIACMYPYFSKKYIYFYDSNWISGNPRGKIAALDKKTLKIVWCWDMFKEIGTAPLHLEIIDTHLYVLDNGLTLHVFEEVS